jgi:curved DNA-binding protein CbpA
MNRAADAGKDQQRIPRLAPGWDPALCSLNPAEGFLLSRIDGQTPWELLLEIGGLPPDEVERCLQRWLSEGILILGETGELAQSEVAAEWQPEQEPEGAIDPNLELSVEMQRRILDLESSLDRPYHALLGVERGADERTIKRAYFLLSKQFHPDRYFRRKIGHFAARLERVFKKLVEAYELLSDPATRAEIERSLGQAEPSRPAEVTPPDGEAADARASAQSGRADERSRKRAKLERLRRHFRIPEEIMAERKFKARQFYQSAMVSVHKEWWLEAAAGARLAIAFDPWCDEYKASFAEIQAKVHQMRAAELLEKANASWDDSARHEALRLYEEVLHYRPCDPEANHRAAQLALEVEELDRASEYAEAACEMNPEVGGYRRTLSRVYRAQGLREKAKAELEEAVRLDPEDSEARDELRSLRRRGGQAMNTGGMR